MAERNDSRPTNPNLDVENASFPNLADLTMGGITAPILPSHKFEDDTLMYVAVGAGNSSTKSSSKQREKSHQPTKNE